jgi:hypothetical protein
MSLAAVLPCRNVIDCRDAGLDLRKPMPSARNRGDELDPCVGADRENALQHAQAGPPVSL